MTRKKQTVHSPAHYIGDGGMEVEDILRQFLGRYKHGYVAHRLASGVEYILRAPRKNGTEDLEKGLYNVQLAVDFIRKHDIEVLNEGGTPDSRPAIKGKKEYKLTTRQLTRREIDYLIALSHDYEYIGREVENGPVYLFEKQPSFIQNGDMVSMEPKAPISLSVIKGLPLRENKTGYTLSRIEALLYEHGVFLCDNE